MRGPSDADAEAWALMTEEGRALLAEAARVAAPRPADLGRWRRSASPSAVSAAVRLAACRARAAAKFRRAGRMWLDPVGLEQATAEPVARHKARRFQGGGRRVVDLCCGIGGDSLALAAIADVWAVDRDQGMCRRTAWNAEVYEVSDRLAAIRADAERFAWPAECLVHVDPDRRAGAGRRSRHLAGYVPGLDFLRALPTRARGGAIKLGPASDFAAEFRPPDFEVELISLAGECKEATAWFGELATCRRRATCLPARATWTDRDGDPAAAVGVAAPSAWIFDPDPALCRAGLLDGFAAAFGLARCSPGVDYLTGPSRVESPFLAAFETLEVFPLDVRRLRREVDARGLGPLEIKTRGVELLPETLRARLKPRGPNPATLVVIGGPGPARVVLARRDGGKEGSSTDDADPQQ